ncbi:MAG: DUF3078 domain-containing protein, partial [Prolixibacteraceae bacterium]|nr:DUF3078 domain-containing protein [Prolixibacteraceae bacterium]
MKVIVTSVLLFIGLSIQASTKQVLGDSIQFKLNELYSFLNSGEWESLDSGTFNRTKELLEYIENSPIDSVVVDLKSDVDSSNLFLKRDIHFISEVENIEGYIRSWEINNSLINIEKHIRADTPMESILVPESEFSGIYNKIPIVTYGDMDRLINDSIVSYPDSILLLIANTKLIRSANKSKETDSIVNSFLNIERKKYTNELIKSFRDSVSYTYRQNYLNDLIDMQKKSYTDSIAKHNIAVLNSYNDSISLVVNSYYKSLLVSLINYVDKLPNELTIYNLLDEPSTLLLQNNAKRFQWVWLKNAQNDSIGLRIENLDKNSFKVFVDESVNLSRLSKKQTLDIERVKSRNALDQKLKKFKTRKPVLSPWKLEGKAYSGFTQTYINDYWSKGGNSSGSALSTFSYDANYSKGKIKWENGFDAKLGLVFYLPDEEVVTERNLHKNSDNIELNSRFGYSAFKEWYYSAEANFKTQFFLGYKNNNETVPNSAIFSPAYLTFSGGFDYKPNKEFSMFLAPLSVKITYVTNPDVDETIFGLLEGQTRKTRIGIAGKLEYSKKITTDISVRSKNSIFINYGINNTGGWQFIKIPDFDSETTIYFKVNQFISTQVNFHFIY